MDKNEFFHLNSLHQKKMASQRTDFENFILDLLTRYSGLKHPENYLTTANLTQFARAFTAASFEQKDKDFNYECLEQLGDVSVNKSIVDYCYRKLGLTGDSKAVKVISKLKSKYASRQGESEMAEALDFWRFVNASEEDKKINRRKLLEDVFEAFIGTLEYVVGKQQEVENIGYIVAYRFISKVMDEINGEDFKRYHAVIEEAEAKGRSKTGALFEEVNDPITKLKEISDRHQLEVSFHPIEEKVGMGADGKPIPFESVPGAEAECYYFYKVYVLISEITEVRDEREIRTRQDHIYQKVIRKEEEMLAMNKKKKKRPYFQRYRILGKGRNGGIEVNALKLVDENPPGDWNLSRAKLLSAIKCLEILKGQGYIWSYEERPAKGIKPDVRRCREGSFEEDEEQNE
jgi:dsRNA-specific ribonuclease